MTYLHYWLIPYLNTEPNKVVYIEIQKVFDSLSYQRLIKTLTQYRLHDSLVNWLKKLLNNITQLYNNTLSNPLTAASGIPQGVIAPFLLIVYINKSQQKLIFTVT